MTDDVQLNTIISSDFDYLDGVHERYKWIPGRNQARPTPEQLAQKQYHVDYIKQSFQTEVDFVLKTLFDFPSKRIQGLHKVNESSITRKKSVRRKQISVPD